MEGGAPKYDEKMPDREKETEIPFATDDELTVVDTVRALESKLGTSGLKMSTLGDAVARSFNMAYTMAPPDTGDDGIVNVIKLEFVVRSVRGATTVTAMVSVICSGVDVVPSANSFAEVAVATNTSPAPVGDTPVMVIDRTRGEYLE